MNDLNFGLDIPDDSLLLRVLREAKKTDYFTGRQHLYQAYETTTGIFNHLGQALSDDAQLNPDLKRPLSSVAMHFAEDTSNTSILYDRFRAFKDRKVYATTGLNWTEFLELPRDMVEHILEECEKQLTRDAATTASVLANLGNRP